MAKKIIELHNGRIKFTGNRIGGDTSSLETRHRRSDNAHKLHLLRRQQSEDAIEAIKECDMIGERGFINKDSFDFRFAAGLDTDSQRKPKRRNSNTRRNDRRYGSDRSQGFSQNFSQHEANDYFQPVSPVFEVVPIVKKRAPFKVVIDESGTMRAVAL